MACARSFDGGRVADGRSGGPRVRVRPPDDRPSGRPFRTGIRFRPRDHRCPGDGSAVGRHEDRRSGRLGHRDQWRSDRGLYSRCAAGDLSGGGLARNGREGSVQRPRASDVGDADSERASIEPYIGPGVRAALRSGLRPGALGKRPREPALVRSLSPGRGRRSAGGGAAVAAARRPGDRGESMMTPNLSLPTRVVVAGAICLAILGGMIVGHAWPLWTGRTVIMRVTPVDPRDPFRGEYVRLGTAANRLRLGASGPATPDDRRIAVRPLGGGLEEPPRGSVVYVQLEPSATGDYLPVTISAQRRSEEPRVGR